jgi:hypothetical protein
VRLVGDDAGRQHVHLHRSLSQSREHPTPPRLTAQDFDQELLILFDASLHGDVGRRRFLDRAAGAQRRRAPEDLSWASRRQGRCDCSPIALQIRWLRPMLTV